MELKHFLSLKKAGLSDIYIDNLYCCILCILKTKKKERNSIQGREIAGKRLLQAASPMQMVGQTLKFTLTN